MAELNLIKEREPIDDNRYFVAKPVKFIGIYWDGLPETGQRILDALHYDAKIELKRDGVLELRVKDRGFDSLDWITVPVNSWLVLSGYDHSRMSMNYEIMSDKRFKEEYEELK